MACHENAQVSQCVFLVAQVENVKVQFLSYSCLSTNRSCRLQRLNVRYHGEISFKCLDLPSLYSCRVQSPLLWGIQELEFPCRLSRYTSNYWTFTHLLSFLGKKWLSFLTIKFGTFLIFAFILNGSAKINLIDFQYKRTIRPGNIECVRSNAFRL